METACCGFPQMAIRYGWDPIRIGLPCAAARVSRRLLTNSWQLHTHLFSIIYEAQLLETSCLCVGMKCLPWRIFSSVHLNLFLFCNAARLASACGQGWGVKEWGSFGCAFFQEFHNKHPSSNAFFRNRYTRYVASVKYCNISNIFTRENLLNMGLYIVCAN